MDDYTSYSLTTNLEMGKFFPDKAKVSIPLYYSYSKEETRPRYNPLDTDMELDDALDAMEGHERDSIESMAVTKTVNRNFAIPNARVGISTKGHPMPYDPANFSVSYSHQHRHTSGETTIYEKRRPVAWSTQLFVVAILQAVGAFQRRPSRASLSGWTSSSASDSITCRKT